jgi:hypothetical protein
MKTENLIYSTSQPYDCAKIIINTILGEPRLEYEISYDIIRVAKAIKNNKEIFKVNLNDLNETNIDLLDYTDKLNDNVKIFTDLKEFSKLYYLFGVTSLKVLCGLVIGKGIIDEKTLFTGDFKLYFDQLSEGINLSQNKFKELLGINRLNNDVENKDYRNMYLTDYTKFTLNAYRLGINLQNYYSEWMRDNSIRFEIGEILSNFYLAIYCILFGMISKFLSESVLEPKILFNNDEELSEANMDKFLSIFLADLTMDKESKQRFIGLLILFSKLTDFYNIFNGIKIEDPIVLSLSKIGKSFDNNTNDDLIEFIDKTILTQDEVKDYYDVYLEGYLTPVSFIETPYVFIDSLLRHDVSSKFYTASYINDILEYPISLYTGDMNKLKMPIITILEEYSNKDKFTDEGTIISLYNLILTEFISKIPYFCSPTYYHILTVFSAGLRYILSNEKYVNELKKKNILKYVYMSVWYLDGLITYLFHEWFRDNKFYMVKNIWTVDKKVPSLKWKSESYCIADLVVYLNTIYEFNGFLDDKTKLNYYERLNTEHSFTSQLNSLTRCQEARNFIGNSRTSDIYKTINNRLSVITHIDDLIQIFNKYNTNKEELLNFILDNLVNDKLPSICLYAYGGVSSNTGGIMSINSLIKNSEDPDSIYKYILQMDDTENNIPVPFDDKYSLKIASNVDKLVDNTIEDKNIKLFLKVLLFIGFAKEALYNNIDKPSYIESIGVDNVERISEDINNDNLIPNIEINKKFNFLDRF